VVPGESADAEGDVSRCHPQPDPIVLTADELSTEYARIVTHDQLDRLIRRTHGRTSDSDSTDAT